MTMTILFETLFGLCCLIALSQLLWALNKPLPSIDHSSVQHLNAWYQTEAQELKYQLARTEISQAFYQQNSVTLQREFLTAQNTIHLKKTLTWLNLPSTFALSVILISLSAGLYWHQGTAPALLHFYQEQRTTQQAEQTLNTLGGTNKVIDLLQAQLKKRPNDPRGWYLLGRLYFTNNQYLQAVKAFSHANILLPNQIDIELSLAESCYLSQQHAAEANYYLQHVLLLDSKNPGALNLSALIAYQNHHYQHAIAVWQQLLTQVPANSDTAKTLQNAIDKARNARTLSAHANA